MTNVRKNRETQEWPILAIFWTLSSWWVLYPLVSLALFMMSFDRVSMAIDFVQFADVSVMSRVLSAVIDRRPLWDALMMSVYFEDLIFYLCLGVFSMGLYRVRWVRVVSLLTVALHITMSAVLVLSLAYALQGTNINTVIAVIQVSGIIIAVLSTTQILMIFFTTLGLLLKEKADALHLE